MRIRSAVVVLLVLWLASACGDDAGGAGPTTTGPAPGTEIDAAGLIVSLRHAGAVVEPAGTFTPTGFTGDPELIRVNGASVQLYEYPGAAAATAEAAYLSPDGGTITVDGSVFLPGWVATPHFFLGGRVIVQYIGDDPAVLAPLESVLGPQFAGGVSEQVPRLIVGTVEPAPGAPMSFEEAALQAASVVLAAVTAVDTGPTYVANPELPACYPSQLVSIEVLEVYAGPFARGDPGLLYQGAGPTDDGSGCGDDPAAEPVVMIMEHDPLYDVGQRYLLAFSPLAGSLDPDPAMVAANGELHDLVAGRSPGQVLFNGRLLVEQGPAPRLDDADVVQVTYDQLGRAIPGPSTGRTLAEYAALLGG